MSAGEKIALDKVEISIGGWLNTDSPETEKKIKSSINVVLCFFLIFTNSNFWGYGEMVQQVNHLVTCMHP